MLERVICLLIGYVCGLFQTGYLYGKMHGIEYLSPISSAQVKSAVLLAGLKAEGKTEYKEIYPSRNHTELMQNCEIYRETYNQQTHGGDSDEAKQTYTSRS